MSPTYTPGDTLLGWHWFRPRPGQVVVALHNGRPLIKRIARIMPAAPGQPAAVWLRGDNAPASTDSRQFGAVPQTAIIARIIAKINV